MVALAHLNHYHWHKDLKAMHLRRIYPLLSRLHPFLTFWDLVAYAFSAFDDSRFDPIIRKEIPRLECW